MRLDKIPSPQELREQAKRLETLALVVEVTGGADVLMDLVRSLGENGYTAEDPVSKPRRTTRKRGDKSGGRHTGARAAALKHLLVSCHQEKSKFKDGLTAAQIISALPGGLACGTDDKTLNRLIEEGTIYMNPVHREKYLLAPHSVKEAQWFLDNPHRVNTPRVSSFTKKVAPNVP